MREEPGERPLVVVVGGGIAGLCAARALLRTGAVRVQVYEREGRAGGVIGTSLADGYMREHAANGFLPTAGSEEGGPHDAVALAKELGVELAPAAPAAKRRWIYRDGRLHALPGHPLALLRTELLSWRGKLAAVGEPWRKPREGETGEETVLEFARRRLGDEVARNFVAPFVTGVFAGRASELSVAAAFPMLVELEAEGGLLRGMIKRQRAARREGRPRARIHAPVAGVEALVHALAKELGSALITDAEVRAIQPDVSAPAGLRLSLAVSRGGAQEELHADAVVLATPAYVSADLVAASRPELAAVLREIPYASAAVVHLGFRRSEVAHPLDGFGFLTVEGASDARVLGTVFESVIWPNRAPEDQVLLRCIYGGTRDPEAVTLADDELVAIARADLGRVLDIHAEPVHANVVKWPRGIAQYTLGHNERVARAEALAAPMGVTLAGSGYHGVAVNSIIADAKRVAAAVFSRLGMAMTLALIWLAVACAGENGTAVTRPSPGPSERAAEAGAAEPGHGRQAPGSAEPQGGAGEAEASAAGVGELAVTVTLGDVPAAMRRPEGRNACGALRRAPLSVHTLGGLRHAVVAVSGGAETRAEARGGQAGDASMQARSMAREADESAASGGAELAIERCRVEPPVAVTAPVGRELIVVNRDQERREVVIERVGGAERAEASLAVMGAAVALRDLTAGVWRVHAASAPEEPAYVVVPEAGYVAVTDNQGTARFLEMPAGRYEISAWHPPLPGGQEPLEVTEAVEIRPRARVELALHLKPTRSMTD